MKILYWNLRGFGNPETRLALKNYCLSHKPDVVFLAEPMIAFDQVPNWYWNSIKINKYCVNNRAQHIPNLWGLWSTEVALVPFFVSSQCIAFEYSYNNAKVYVAAVYAHTSYLIRRQLWADLTLLQSQYVGPWLFVGDFNAILGAHEKRGKRLPSKISCGRMQTILLISILLGSVSRGQMVDRGVNLLLNAWIVVFVIKHGGTFGRTSTVVLFSSIIPTTILSLLVKIYQG
jgi:hypothetical protein